MKEYTKGLSGTMMHRHCIKGLQVQGKPKQLVGLCLWPDVRLARRMFPCRALHASCEDPLELACYTLIVDDIVLPSGETIMESLGGGGAPFAHAS